MTAFLRRIYGLILRHLYILPRNYSRWLDIIYWPLLDLLVWGYTTVYINRSGAGHDLNFVVLFIGALISWDVLFRAQQAITITFLEDVWARNILNLFVSPVTPFEFLTGAVTYGMLKHGITMSVMTVMAYALYDYNYFTIGLGLIPAILNLLLFGWALGIVTTGLILRYGQSAEVLAWGLAFLTQPFIGVFYPVSIMPRFFQVVAHFLPPTYVFEELRSIVIHHQYIPGHMYIAFSLNIVYMAVATLFFNMLWKNVKRKGYLARLGNE